MDHIYGLSIKINPTKCVTLIDHGYATVLLGIPMLKVRLFGDRLIFNMEIPIYTFDMLNLGAGT